jgi:hypothetical protein
VVASKPSQSPKEENAIAFQSFLKPGIDMTLSRTRAEGAAGLGIEFVIPFS